MKKLILVMVCIIVLAIFIALNYLLWDRDNKIQSFQDLNSSKSVSIDALTDKIKNLDETVRQLNSTVDSLESKNKELFNSNTELDSDKTKLQSQIQNLNAAISRLKLSANLDVLQNNIRKWTESLEKGQYDVSYRLMDTESINIDAFKSMDGFSGYFKNNIKSISIKSIKLAIDEIPADKAGNIIYKIVFDIKKTDNADATDQFFTEGQSTMYMTIGFNIKKNNWVITAMTKAL